MAVFRRIAPVSVVVQIFISDHVLRNILSRPRMFPSAVSLGAPRVKLVVIRAEILHIRAQLIRSRKHRIIVCANGIRRSASGNLAFPVANSDGGRIAAFVNVDAIDARSCNRESQIRRINFVSLVVIQMTHAHENCAFSQANLRDVIVQIQKRKTSAVEQSDGRRIQLQFDPPVLIRPQFIARSDRSIYSCIDPILRACWLKRNGSLGIRETCYYRWRIVSSSASASFGRNSASAIATPRTLATFRACFLNIFLLSLLLTTLDPSLRTQPAVRMRRNN